MLFNRYSSLSYRLQREINMLYQLFIVLIAAGAVHAQLLGYVRIDNIINNVLTPRNSTQLKNLRPTSLALLYFNTRIFKSYLRSLKIGVCSITSTLRAQRELS